MRPIAVKDLSLGDSQLAPVLVSCHIYIAESLAATGGHIDGNAGTG